MRRRLLLILAGGLALFLLVLGGTMLWAGRHMRSPEFRAELVRLLGEATGLPVGLEGELDVSVFPWLGLSARGLTLGNPPEFGPEFGTEPMLRARSISARIKVLPLIARRLVFDTVDLTDATVRLGIDAQGRRSWDGLEARLRAQEPAIGSQDAFFRKISVRGLRISGGTASLEDKKRGQVYAVSSVSLRTGRIEPGRPLDFTLNCDFAWARPGLESRIGLTGVFNWGQEQPVLPLLTQAKVQAEVGGGFLPKDGKRAELAATVNLDRDGRDLRLGGLRIRLLGAELSGELSFSDFLDGFRMRGRLTAQPFDPGEVINAYWPQTVGRERTALVRWEGPVDLDADEERMDFSSPGLVIDGARVRGRARVGYGERPGLDFELSADKADADAYLAAFSGNATGGPVLVEDLPLAYLRDVLGQGRLAVAELKLAGVPAQGAELTWKAAGGAHKAELKPANAQGGTMAAELSASFAGGLADKAGKPTPAVLGYLAGLRLNGVDAARITWARRGGAALSGRMDLSLRAEARPAPAQAQARMGQVLRRALGDVTVGVTQAALDFEERPAQGKPGARARRMEFSSLSAQARFTAAQAPDADWALQAEGGLQATGVKPALNFDGKVSGLLRQAKGGLALTGAQASGRLKGWFLPRRENEAQFSARGNLDFASQALGLSSFTAQTCGMSLAGSLEGRQVFGSSFSLSGHVRCQEGDPRRVLAALDFRPRRTADRKALTRLTGEADLAVNAKGVQATNLSAQLDDTWVRGSYAVAGYEAPRQSFALSAGNLDLDRYLEPKEPPLRRGAQPERPQPEPLPVETLREISLDGSLAFREFKLHGLTARTLKCAVGAKDGTLLVKPLHAGFYGGELTGEYVAQAGQRTVQTRLSLAAKNFQAAGLMLGWAGKEYVTGRADMFLDVGGAGATDQEVLASLEGMAGFKITDGSYHLSGSPEQGAQPLPPGATAQKGGAPRKTGTPFSLARAQFSVQRGVFRNEDFRLEGPSIVVTGRGTFSPAEDAIALSLTASMTGVPDVPIRVYGRLKDPEVEIPTGALINNTIKEILGLPLKPIKFLKDLLF